MIWDGPTQLCTDDGGYRLGDAQTIACNGPTQHKKGFMRPSVGADFVSYRFQQADGHP